VEVRERSVQYYQTVSGTLPFREWRLDITDLRTKAAIDARIARLRAGNFGDSRPVGDGVSESVIDFGAGYRIYYHLHGDLIILLCGGDKSTQSVNISRARVFWKDYKEREP
jgi:putative addiction module killer protein